MDLDGRVALVTGSTRGIGWATAQELARHGATVIVNGRDPARVAGRARELSDTFGRRSDAACFDVTDSAAVTEAFQQVFRAHKRLDILVNNAGVLQDALLGMISAESIDITFRTNAIGPLHILQAGVRLMSRSAAGSIINISSIIGTHGNEGQAVYAASKAALIGLTLAASKELAPMGIRVNAIAPGFIDTEMVRLLPPAKYEERIRSIKMGRIGTPQDVANAVLFFASDLSSYVTGQVLGVDGGMLV